MSASNPESGPWGDMLDGSPMAFVIHDLDGKVVHANEAFGKLLGYPMDQVLGMSAHDVIHPEDRADRDGLAAQLGSGVLDKAITDRRLIDSTGRTVWVRSYKSAVRHGDSRLILVCLQDMGEWHYRLDQLDHAATHDELTGLLNRAGLTKEVERILGQGLSGRLAVIDLNGLKSVNDAHGHAAGDVVLKATAAQLSAARSGSRLVGRLGGDEFVMVDCGSAEELRPVLAKALAAEIPLGPGLTTTLSASIGEAAFGPGSIFDEVLHAADREMYRHKRARALSSGRSVLPQARAGEDDEWDTIELPLAREAY